MDRQRGEDVPGASAEQLLTLSSGARRLIDIIAVAEAPVRYEALRHLVRVSEETMTDVLREAVATGLVRRGDDPFTYVPASDAIAAEIEERMDGDRVRRLREQIVHATRAVME